MNLENKETVIDYNVEFALITEILHGGYLDIESALEQSSDVVKSLYHNNDIIGLISYQNSIYQSKKINPKWGTAIKNSPGLRGFLIGGLHDAKIINICFDEKMSSVILNLSLAGCMHPFSLKQNHNMSVLLLKSYLDKKTVDKINKKNDVFVIGYGLNINDKITISFNLDLCSNHDIEKIIIKISCDEIIIF